MVDIDPFKHQIIQRVPPDFVLAWALVDHLIDLDNAFNQSHRSHSTGAGLHGKLQIILYRIINGETIGLIARNKKFSSPIIGKEGNIAANRLPVMEFGFWGFHALIRAQMAGNVKGNLGTFFQETVAGPVSISTSLPRILPQLRPYSSTSPVRNPSIRNLLQIVRYSRFRT